MANTRRRQSERDLRRVEITAFPIGEVTRLRAIAAAMKRQEVERQDLLCLIGDAFARFRVRALDNLTPPPQEARLAEVRRVAALVADSLLARGGREGYLLGRRLRQRIEAGRSCHTRAG